MPSIHIGTEFIGKVDKINKESVQTKFFILGMPLFPLGSFYCLCDPFPGSQAIRIPLNSKSVVLGYLRWWLSIVSIMFIIIGYAMKEYVYWVTGILGLAIFLTTFFFGRLSKSEIKRRQVLTSVVGMGAHPKILHRETVQSILAQLEEMWGQANLVSLHENWRNVYSLGATEQHLYPLLYCLAVYANEIEFSERVWKNLELTMDKIKDRNISSLFGK